MLTKDEQNFIYLLDLLKPYLVWPYGDIEAAIVKDKLEMFEEELWARSPVKEKVNGPKQG